MQDTSEGKNIPELIETLEGGSSWEIRASAARELGECKAESAIAALRKAATYDEDALVRAAVLEVLGRMGDVQNVPLLVASLKDPHGEVRLAALDALRAYDWDVIRSTILHTIQRSDSPKIVTGLLTLLADRPLQGAEEAIISALERFDTTDVTLLAVRLLGRFEDLETENYLIKYALRNVGPETVIATIESLVARNSTNAESTLQHLAMTSTMSHVQIAACDALSKLGTKASIDILETLAMTETGPLAEAASQAAVKLQNRLGLNITDTLEKMMDDMFLD